MLHFLSELSCTAQFLTIFYSCLVPLGTFFICIHFHFSSIHFLLNLFRFFLSLWTTSSVFSSTLAGRIQLPDKADMATLAQQREAFKHNSFFRLTKPFSNSTTKCTLRNHIYSKTCTIPLPYNHASSFKHKISRLVFGSCPAENQNLRTEIFSRIPQSFQGNSDITPGIR